MVAAFDYCLHGKGGAAPSIDTAMHGLVDAAHVDHLHPDSGIAIATAADGEQLTKEIFGDKVVWVPWRRPGFQLGLDIAAIKTRQPAGGRRDPRRPRHHRLGRHQRRGRGQLAAGSSRPRRPTSTRTAAPSPFGAVVAGVCRPAARPSGARRPRPSPRTSGPSPRRTSAMVGHFTDADVVLEFLAGEKLAHARRARHLVPRPLPAHQGQAARARPARRRHGRGVRRPPRRAARRHTARTTPPTTSATPRPTRPPMRGADPAIVLVPGVGMFSYGKDKQTARVAGEFYVNAINVMRGAESVSTYAPIAEAEKFRIEYWALEEAKLQRLPKPKRHAGRIALVTGAASGIGKAIATRLAAEGACVVIADLDLDKAQAAATEIGDQRRRRRRAGERHRRRRRSQAAVDATLLAFGGIDLVVNNAGLSISKPLLETTEADWDLQHDVMAKGSFLVAQAAARAMIDQRLGGDIVYIVVEERRLRRPEQHRLQRRQGRPGPPGPAARRRARRARHPGQRRSTPTASCAAAASSPAAGAPSAPPSTACPRRSSAPSTPSAPCSSARCSPSTSPTPSPSLTSDEFSHTTGLHVPVDAGVAAAFLR